MPLTICTLALTAVLNACSGAACLEARTWPAPMRTVDGASLSSPYQPDARISVPDEAVHVGAQRWALHDAVDHVGVGAPLRHLERRDQSGAGQTHP